MSINPLIGFVLFASIQFNVSGFAFVCVLFYRWLFFL